MKTSKSSRLIEYKQLKTQAINGRLLSRATIRRWRTLRKEFIVEQDGLVLPKTSENR